MNEGCTVERRQHGTVVVENRTVTKGGMVIGHGNRVIDHCYLDELLHAGLLGNEDDSEARYTSGLSLRKAYFEVYESAPVSSPILGGGYQRFVAEANTPKDDAEEWYDGIMRALPVKYRILAKSVCVYDTRHAPTVYPLIREMLDALFGALHRVRANKGDQD